MNKIENLNKFKRLLALLSVGVMALSSLPAFAEGEVEETTNETAITMVEEEPQQLTYDEYINNVKVDFIEKIEPLVVPHHEVLGLIYVSYYYYNYMYCRDIRQDLIDNYIIYEDLDMGGDAANFVAVYLADINSGILKKNINFDELYDISILIKNPEIKELTHNAFVNYYKVYEKGTVDCDEYKELKEQLKELKKKSYFLGYLSIEWMLEELYKHCIVASCDEQEIKEYFVLKDNEITNINSKKYKDLDDMCKNIKAKEEKSQLEQYILLIGKHPKSAKGSDIRAAIRKIEKDYKEAQKIKQK